MYVYAAVLSFLAAYVGAAPHLPGMIQTIDVPDMMRLQQAAANSDGPQVEIQIHQVAVDDYPLLTFLRIWFETSGKCMAEVNIPTPDFAAELADAFGFGKGDADDSTEATTTATPVAGPTTSPATTTRPLQPQTLPPFGYNNHMARMLARFARRFEPMFQLWKNRVDGFEKAAEILQSDKMNKFIDSMTVEQFRTLSKCFTKQVSMQMKDKIQMEWEPIETLRNMLFPNSNESTATTPAKN